MFTKRNVSLTAQARGAPNTAGVSRAAPDNGTVDGKAAQPAQPGALYDAHAGVRASILNSMPCVSTGSRSLDQVLQHGGLPLGSIMLVLEHGNTDFASSILKAFASYGVQEARDGMKTQVIAVTDARWLQALPSVEKPKEKPAQAAGDTRTQSQMKIAWRYHRTVDSPGSLSQSGSGNVAYARDLNYKAYISPRANATEVLQLFSSDLMQLLDELETRLKNSPKDRIYRVVLPNFLHPYTYKSTNYDPQVLVPFFMRLRSLTRQYSLAVMISLSLPIFDRTNPLEAQMELLSDSVIELEPRELDDVQGLLHIRRLAHMSDRGYMIERLYEYSFKLGKSQFEVASWGIPAIVGDKDDTAKELY